MYNPTKVLDELSLTGRCNVTVIIEERTYECSIVAIGKTLLFNWGYNEPFLAPMYEKEIRDAYIDRLYAEDLAKIRSERINKND